MQLIPTNKQKEVIDSRKKNQNKERSRLRTHKLTTTCACVDSKNRFVYSASKDGSIIKWCLQTRRILLKIKSVSKKQHKLDKAIQDQHHLRHINCLAISSDDRFLASGGWDRKIRIWSADTLEWIHTFSLHKDEITALAFRSGHPTLYSGSADRSVMIWTLEDDDNRCYVESLYGHESPITSMDASRKERVLTAGGRDQSLRIWKIVEQAQTVFQSKHESVDVVSYIDDKTFVSGGEDGTISIWTTMKRNPVLSKANAHPIVEENPKEHKSNPQSESPLINWISALATHPLKEANQNHVVKKRKAEDETINSVHSDEESSSDDNNEEPTAEVDTNIALIASGSCDSKIRVWRLVKVGGVYNLKMHQTLDCLGFVNDLKFTSDGKKLIAACGQEHKFGRWWKLSGLKNTIRIFDVNKLS